MLTPVTGFTCGLSVGDLAPLYRHLRALMVGRALEARGTLVEFAPVDPGLQLDSGAICEALGVGPDRDCCRKTLSTAMVFSDVY
ncbi:MAG TPA: hypothetical protein VNI01_06870 [Elusimicrobiota bacterium]|nr:hypothetical protein [Elusimicrobiota bacterium]